MKELEPASQERVRVCGALTAPALDLLLDVVSRAEVQLDLAEVREADSDAVHLLALLPPELFSLVACPKWLALRIETERWPRPSAAA